MPSAAQYPAFDPLGYAQRLKAANVPKALRELAVNSRQTVQSFDAKAERSFLELKADIAKAQADILKTQQTVLELKAHVDVRHAETQRDLHAFKAEAKGQFTLLHWMLTAVLGVLLTIALKLFLWDGLQNLLREAGAAVLDGWQGANRSDGGAIARICNAARRQNPQMPVAHEVLQTIL